MSNLINRRRALIRAQSAPWSSNHETRTPEELFLAHFSNPSVETSTRMASILDAIKSQYTYAAPPPCPLCPYSMNRRMCSYHAPPPPPNPSFWDLWKPYWAKASQQNHALTCVEHKADHFLMSAQSVLQKWRISQEEVRLRTQQDAAAAAAHAEEHRAQEAAEAASRAERARAAAAEEEQRDAIAFKIAELLSKTTDPVRIEAIRSFQSDPKRITDTMRQEALTAYRAHKSRVDAHVTDIQSAGWA